MTGNRPLYFDDPARSLGNTPPSGLRIVTHWRRQTGEIDFTVIDESGHDHHFPQNGLSYTDALKFARYIEVHLGKIASGFRRREAWRSVRHRLKSLGWQAARWILPLELLRFVRANLRPSQSLIISTDECWIPWEMIFDPELDGFWGEKFILSRQQVRDIRFHHLPVWPTPARDCSVVSRVINVVGDRTRSSHLTTSLWRHLDGVEVISNDPGRNRYFSVASLIRAIEDGAEIVHVTCHGEVDDGGERYLRLGPQAAENFFYAFDVLPLDIGGRLLFLNACSALAPAGPEFGPWLGLTTFGWLVGLRKKGAVIGSYAPILASAATDFAVEFYRRFLGDHMTVGEALYETKQMLASEEKPFGLVYSLYGDPTLQMSVHNPKLPE